MRGFARFFAAFLPIALVVGGAIFIITVMALNRPEPEKAQVEPRGLAVFVTPAERSDVALNVATQGEARPLREIALVSQVSGRVVSVNDRFIEGGFFERGDMLVQIDQTDYRLAVTRAQSSVAQAQRALERERAEAEIAARDWEEFGEGEASALTLRVPQLAEAEAALAAAQATLSESQVNLDRTTIRAPFTGRVREKSADIGQFVSPGQGVGRIFSTDVVQLRLPLSDAELAQVGLPVAFEATEDNPGPTVRFSATLAGQPREWTGHIKRTDSAIDPRTRLVYAIAEVVDPYGEGADGDAPLAVGLFVEAEIEGRVVPGAFALPRAALRGADEIYVAKPDGKMTVRTVDVVFSDRERVVLTSGLTPGEYVIISPIRGAENMAVRALDPDTRQAIFPDVQAGLADADAPAGDAS